MSVFVKLIKGEYDDALKWPYTGTVAYKIMNWKEDSNHAQECINFNGQAHGNRPTGENSNGALGVCKALPHSKLNCNNAQYDYLYDDTIAYSVM